MCLYLLLKALHEVFDLLLHTILLDGYSFGEALRSPITGLLLEVEEVLLMEGGLL